MCCCMRSALRQQSWRPFIIFFSLTTFISCSLLAYDLVTDPDTNFWGVVGMSVQLVGTVISMCLMPDQVRYGVRNQRGSRRRWRPRRQSRNVQNADQKSPENTTANEEPPNSGQDVSVSVMKSGDSSLDTNNHNTQQQRLNQGNQNRLDGMAEQSMGGGDTDSARPLTSEQPEAGQPKIPSHNPSSTGTSPTVPAHA
ncbi:uncharacterized protein LOC142351787 isoform X1 [Convolutriloba macropyga]|uniref:uncharacterized protein LOC142351787 isoform X1 n=1 Tax=Convolutriloba macropyga TaxID=536237 RepID=UPI003F522D7F